MSIRASDYARDTLEHDDQLSARARLVFMLLAERANTRTALTYTGEWLHRAAGARTYAPVRRALAELTEAGYVAVEHRPGKSHVIRFPLAAVLSTPSPPADRVDGRDEQAYPARNDVEPCAPARGPLRAGAPRTGSVPVIYPAACDTDGCACDGTGWEYVPDGARGYVQPCPTRRAAS